jgi:short-subunit dehydrogenase
MRNTNKAADLEKRIKEDNLDIEIITLEVTDIKSIQVAVTTIIEKDGKIDLLINNAGAGFAKNNRASNRRRD